MHHEAKAACATTLRQPFLRECTLIFSSSLVSSRVYNSDSDFAEPTKLQNLHVFASYSKQVVLKGQTVTCEDFQKLRKRKATDHKNGWRRVE